MSNLLDAFPYLRVLDGAIIHVSAAVWNELGCEPRAMPAALDQLGTRLDDTTFDELCSGAASLRLRLGPGFSDRPIRLRRLDVESDDPGDNPSEVVLEVRSLAAEFRLESLLRRSGLGHMLISPSIELEWSLASNELDAVLPGDPMSWIELMDANDMQTLGKAIFKAGADPNLRSTVSHRLNADRTHTIIDHVESAMHDPDLRAVLVRSHFEDQRGPDEPIGTLAPFAGITVSDHMPIGVVVASHAGKVLHRNAVAAELVGARVGQLVLPDGAKPWMMSQLGPEQSERYQSVFAAASAGQPAHCTVNSPFDSSSWLRVSISPAAASTVVLTIEDTTDLAEAERALRASNRLLEALDSHSEDLVIVFDARGRSRYVNTTTRTQLGDATAIAHIDDVVEMVNVTDRSVMADLVKRVTSNPSGSGEIEFRIQSDANATSRWHHASMTNLIDDPDVQGIVLTVRDVHERHLVERELRFKATHDALTTLPDRAALQTQLESLLHESDKVGHRTALMFCDIDNFKLINDQAGHRVGDLVLTQVADRFRAAMRSSDFVGRFGGDEFVVVAPAVADETHAMELAGRLFDAVTGTTRCGEIDVEVSVSMGVALTDAECTTASGLLNRADTAMYTAKKQGRGQFALYVPRAQGTDGTDPDLRVELRSAIADGGLTLHYQPIVPLKSGLGKGYESLARWEHPEQGVVAAKRLFDMAEVSGLGAELGTELLRLAHDDDRPWFATDGGGFIAINVSASQLGHPDAATRFVERMHERELDPSELVIELTEASFAQGLIVQGNLDVLRRAGIRIFLDDFGVGYSSLSHLHQFPVDGIKIDASVVSPVVDESLVKLIVSVAATLDIRTVAEGVETSDQLDTVTRLGVDYAQGYLLGHPTRIPTTRSLDP